MANCVRTIMIHHKIHVDHVEQHFKTHTNFFPVWLDAVGAARHAFLEARIK